MLRHKDIASHEVCTISHSLVLIQDFCDWRLFLFPLLFLLLVFEFLFQKHHLHLLAETLRVGLHQLHEFRDLLGLHFVVELLDLLVLLQPQLQVTRNLRCLGDV